MGIRGMIAGLFGLFGRRRPRRRRTSGEAAANAAGEGPGRPRSGAEGPIAGETGPQVDFSDYEGFLHVLRQGVGASDDLVVHEIRLGLDRGRRAALVFVDGMVDRRVIGDDITSPLLRPGAQQGLARGKSLVQVISEQVLAATQVDSTENYGNFVDRILGGDTAIVIEGQKRALLVDTKKFSFRGPDRPLSELNIKGSFEGFTEVLKVNITMVRRRIRSENLRVKMVTVGEQSHNQLAILHIAGIANPALVAEVERRVRGIEHEAVLLVSIVQCLVRDNPLTPFPLFRDTERPDFAAQELLEGKVVLLADNTPFATALPSTLFDFLKSSEDYAAVFWGASLLRPVRYLAFAISIYLPAIYVAVLSVHPRYIPHPLALAVIASRVGTPFPPVVELILLLLAVEILREAAVRLPSAMGPALATVGGIVLGQAAVNARIVGDLSLIVAAITGIAQLIAPGFEIGYVTRLLAWPFLLAGAVFGAFGLAMATLVLVGHLANLESVGVPYLGPLVTGERALLTDTFVRAPFAALRYRPAYLWPLDLRKQGRVGPRSPGRAGKEAGPVGVQPLEERFRYYVERSGERGRSPEGAAGRPRKPPKQPRPPRGGRGK
jgi:hypothetical protein